MNLIIVLLIVATTIASPWGGLGILSGIGLLYCINPKQISSKFTKWSWYNWKV